MEANGAVKVFADLSTPLGQYNHNRAVLIRNDGQTKLDLVVETKNRDLGNDLRPKESGKSKVCRKTFY